MEDAAPPNSRRSTFGGLRSDKFAKPGVFLCVI